MFGNIKRKQNPSSDGRESRVKSRAAKTGNIQK